MNTVFLEKICRCCLNESGDMTINLSDRARGFDPFTFDENCTYSDLIYLCTSVRCDLDVVDANDHIVELPRNVCENCLQELRSAFFFRQKCESSEQLLREQTLAGITTQDVREETIEFEQNPRNVERLYAVSPVKEAGLEEERIVIKAKDPVLEAINETSVPDETKNTVEVQIIPATSTDDAQTLNKTKEIKLRSHDLTSAYEMTQLKDKKDCQPQNQAKKYKCDECQKEFHTEKGYSTHKNVHIGESTKRKFLCSICGKFFSTKQRLKVHGAMHSGEKKHQCKECDKKFATESRLRCHRRIHTGEKPFSCDQCDLTFAQGNALRCHKRIHTGEKPYECEICKKRFTQNTILKTHMTLHTGKTVKCPDCGKLFSRASNLILHRREHTGDRPYRCPYEHCTNRYRQKSHLNQHMDTHLGVKHTCEICQKVYSKRWSLKCHMYTHAKIKPHSCSLCDAEFTRRDKFRNHLKTVHVLSDLAADNLNTSHFTERETK